MLEIQAQHFVKAVSDLEMIQSLAISLKVVKKGLNPTLFQDILTKVDSLQSHCIELELPASAAGARRLKTVVSDMLPTDTEPAKVVTIQDTNKLIQATTSLRHRLIDELEGRLFLSVQGRDLALLEQPEPIFGADVHDKFPDAVEDISEAGKCFAMGRYTASVFHLMRAMELVVSELAYFLGATVQNDQGKMLPWGILLANVKPKIDNLPAGATRNSWNEIHALLYAVKEAWRNSSMHPKKTYTEDEAREILGAVKAFMLRLAQI